MKSFFVACAVCGSLDAEELFPSFFRTQVSSAQMIVICRRCGFVYRNPHIPDICADHYEDVGSWRDEHVYIERLRGVADRIAGSAPVANGERYLEIGCGPGWLAEHLAARFVDAQAVLLEPSFKVAEHAQRRNPNAVVLPSLLDEASLPAGAFSCIIACGVDYLFQHHRKDIETIAGLLRDGGVLYIERNVFLDQRALTDFPIFDVEDLFGLNHRMNTWFGRAQFIEYLSEFFEVFDVFEYVSNVLPPPYSRHNVITGVFGRKRPGGARVKSPVVNRYAEHLKLLRTMALESTREQLRLLAEGGIRNVVICGVDPAARLLASTIREEDRLRIVGFGSLSGANSELCDELTAQFASPRESAEIDAYLVASLVDQEAYVAQLQAMGCKNVLRCFRPGLPTVWADSGTMQLKALLPAFLRESPHAVLVNS